MAESTGRQEPAGEEREHDVVDRIAEQWSEQRPDIDPWPMVVVGRVLRLARVLDAAVGTALATHGLQFWQFDVLATLRRSGEPYELAPSQMSESLMISNSAMTNRIDRLENSGLVTRRHSAADRRAVLIRLTDEGLLLVDKALETHVTAERAMIDVLSLQEQQQLAVLLRRFHLRLTG